MKDFSTPEIRSTASESPLTSAMSSRKGKRRALIVDKRAVMATEMCRQLARRGFSVSILGERDSPAFRSAYCARAIVSPPCDDMEFLPVLRQTLRSAPFDAVFVCNEEVLERMLALPVLGDCAGLLLPSRDTVRTALSKFAMLRVAREAGAQTPRTIAAADATDLPAAARVLGFPLIVKGDRGEAGQHVRLVTDRAGLEAAYREIKLLESRSSTHPVLQEFVRGTAYSVGGLYDRGHALRVCIHRKLVAVPPLGGLTVRGITERCAGALEEASRIAEALNYTGLAHIEFIRDSRGKFRFLEINPRVWGTIGVAEHAGVDFYTPYRDLAAGFRVASRLDFREGIRFHRVLREARMIKRRPSRVLGFIRDCLDPAVCSDFEWRDPGPHLSAFLSQFHLHQWKPPRPQPIQAGAVRVPQTAERR
jgi:carbamoylphosphate synthase large subunit